MYMDAAARIYQLMQERGMSMYMLAKIADISPNTLQNMYTRHTQPSIATVEAICKGLGISLAHFFQEGDEVVLNGEQRKLLDSWAYLSKEKREALLKVIELMNDNLYA